MSGPIISRINRTHARARRRIGYRGLCLAIFGVIFVLIGLAVLGEPGTRPDLIHTRLPALLRVCIWSIPGLFAIVAATHPRLQSWGYGILFFPPAERCVSFFIAWLPTGEGWSWSRLTGALIYLLLMILVVVIASWPEPTDDAEMGDVQALHGKYGGLR
jgi:hypothetical protein